MLGKILTVFGIKIETWHLSGYDTFAGDSYHLAGTFFSEKAARKAAMKELKTLEKLQPTRYSGGQQPGGIQDQISIVRPDGSSYRIVAPGFRTVG